MELPLPPEDLKIKDVHWKYLLWGILKGKNILLYGMSGSGKTLSAIKAAEAIGRSDKFFKINLGSSQDPRATLIGNTHLKKDEGTIFHESGFIKAIRTEGTIILLDELSRCHPDGWNILLSALDPIQRYVRLDEKEDSEVVPVAKGVCFISTANIGAEYTSTRIMDRALMDRFSVKIEIEPLSMDEEFDLLANNWKSVDIEDLKVVCLINSEIREEYKKSDSKITTCISTRIANEMAEMLNDGFDLMEILDNVVYSAFSNEGGDASERSFIKKLCQKYIGGKKLPKKLFR
jgi:MoxR-like ATPase